MLYCNQIISKKRNTNGKMYRIKNDQRSVRSAGMFCDRLANLMQEMPVHAITVKDLVAVFNL